MGGQPFKLVANLPYQVVSPLLITLAVMEGRPMRRAVVMVQREVADRLGAEPGTKAYGPLTVLVQAFYEVRMLSVLPPSCFWPRPGWSRRWWCLTGSTCPSRGTPRRCRGCCTCSSPAAESSSARSLGRDTPLPEGITPDRRPDSLTVEELAALAGV